MSGLRWPRDRDAILADLERRSPAPEPSPQQVQEVVDVIVANARDVAATSASTRRPRTKPKTTT